MPPQWGGGSTRVCVRCGTRLQSTHAGQDLRDKHQRLENEYSRVVQIVSKICEQRNALANNLEGLTEHIKSLPVPTEGDELEAHKKMTPMLYTAASSVERMKNDYDMEKITNAYNLLMKTPDGMQGFLGMMGGGAPPPAPAASAPSKAKAKTEAADEAAFSLAAKDLMSTDSSAMVPPGPPADDGMAAGQATADPAIPPPPASPEPAPETGGGGKAAKEDKVKAGDGAGKAVPSAPPQPAKGNAKASAPSATSKSAGVAKGE